MTPYDHPDWRGFLGAVRANPDDDTARLVAADWLEERGGRLRADLIRCHVAWEAGDHSGGLRTRINGLFGRCQPRVFRTLKIDMTGTGYKWDRGFITEVYAPAAWWLAHGDAVLAREPVERVTLTTWPELTFHGPNYSLVGDPADPADRWFKADALPSPADGIERRVLSARWPGVEFVLPSEPLAGQLAGAYRNVGSAVNPVWESMPVQRWEVREPAGEPDSYPELVRDAVARGMAEHIDRQFRAG